MFLYIDKPKGITSHDVIGKIRRLVMEGPPPLELRRVKVGHAGTLDPNATGLLIVGVGRESTKKLWTKFGKLDKTYIAEITLGEERETDDAEGKISKFSQKQVRVSHNAKSVRDDRVERDRQIGPKSLPTLSKSQLNKLQIEKVLYGFIGEQMQVPPQYSAIKINGKTAYSLARDGKTVELEPRKVTIYKIKLLKYKFPIIKIETKVSSGTYIRSLARDLGRKLGCGAYLYELRRTKIGKYKIEESVKLEDLNKDKFTNNYQ